MGDRANIVVRDAWPEDLGDKEAVFLYGHWSGTDMPELLRLALSAGRDRWSDPTYLARIVFQTMIGEDSGTTGFGISTRLTDNEYDLIVLRGERVHLLAETAYTASGFATLDHTPSCSFDDLCDAPDDHQTWETLNRLCDAVAGEA